MLVFDMRRRTHRAGGGDELFLFTQLDKNRKC
jgi:hypothetical protein